MARLREDPRGSQLINQRRAFGDRLRRQRERLGVSLNEIAETTKVAASLFASLERGDCSRWPGGVYNRAFIRGYARAVKLDPDEMAAEFAECYETPVAEAPPARTPAKSSHEIPVRPALRLTLEADPAEGLRRLARAAALAVADLLAIGALAAAVVLTTGGPLWRSLAITAVAYHLLVRIIGGTARLHRLARTDTVTPEPLVDPIEGEPEVAVSGTASTVA